MHYPILFHISGSARDGLEFHLDLVCGRTRAEDTAFVFEYFSECCLSGDLADSGLLPNRYYTGEYHWSESQSWEGEVDYEDWLENVKPFHRTNTRCNMFEIKANVTMDLEALSGPCPRPRLPRKLKKRLKSQGRDWKTYWLHSGNFDQRLGYVLGHSPAIKEISDGMDAACLEHMRAAARDPFLAYTF
jgi:hypothetical protein